MVNKVLTGHSFGGSIRYICKDGQRAEVLATEGVRAHDYKLMIEDFRLQAELNPSKRQACFHAVLSFYPEENPGNEKMVEIGERYLKELGITNTQYAITKHTDKAHLHLHIVANMVNSDGRSIRDNWIGYRGKKVAQKLTQEYGLTPALQKDLALTNLEALSNSEANRYKIYSAIREALPRCRTMEDLEASLLKQGIGTQYKYRSGTKEKQGVSFRIGEDCFKGSKVDRQYSLSNLEKTLAQQQKQVLQQQGKPVHHPETGRSTGEQKQRSTPRVTPANSSGDTIEDTVQEITQGIEKIVEGLLKPEQRGGQVPYPFAQQAQQRRKKKRGQGL